MLAEKILYIAEANQEPTRPYRPRPSNSGPEKCVRSLVYHAMGTAPKPLSGRAILKMKDSARHEDITAAWLDQGDLKPHSRQLGLNCIKLQSPFLKKPRICDICKMEVPAHTMHGHIDWLITELTGIIRLVEHKALRSSSFCKYESGDYLPYDYISQSVIYTLALKILYGDKMGFSILLIKNKDDSNYMEYHLEYDEQADIVRVQAYRLNTLGRLVFVREAMLGDVITQIRYKFRLVDSYSARKVLPKREYELSGWQCKNCQWKETCWKNYDLEIEKRREQASLGHKLQVSVAVHETVKKQLRETKKEYQRIHNEVRHGLQKLNTRSGFAGKLFARMIPVKKNRFRSREHTTSKYERLLIRQRDNEV
jgi:hypothetical protein